MTRILYVVSTLAATGPTNQLKNLLNHLDSDFKPHIVTLSREPTRSLLSKFSAAGVKITCLNMTRYQGALKAQSTIQRLVAQLKPDLIHTQGIRADVLAAKLPGNPLVVSTLRNAPFDDYPMKFGRIRGTAMAYRHIWALKRIAHPVACSKTVALEAHSHGIRCRVVQNGVDTETYRPASPSAKSELRRNLGLPEAADIFVTTGSLIKRKDPVTVIKGFQQSQVGGESVLLLLGAGPLMPICQELAAADSRIRLVGHVENVVDYCRASDAFVSASWSEGLPNTVMEAMGCGLPVILSDIAPHREVLSDDAAAGRLFSAGSVSELAKAIGALTPQDRTDAGGRGRAIVDQHLSARAMSTKYQVLYREVLGES